MATKKPSKKVTQATWNKLENLFSEMGQTCGNKIQSIAQKLHPDALFSLPLYRGCLIVLKQTLQEIKCGSCTIILYHDPHWMGEDVSKGTLPEYKHTLQICGQRSGADIFLDGCELGTSQHFADMKQWQEMLDLIQPKKVK